MSKTAILTTNKYKINYQCLQEKYYNIKDEIDDDIILQILIVILIYIRWDK